MKYAIIINKCAQKLYKLESTFNLNYHKLNCRSIQPESTIGLRYFTIDFRTNNIKKKKIMGKKKVILAFIHIEKAAGQTLIRILENNYTFKHCRVAPLKKEHKGIFTADAMKTIFRINSLVRAISGHSIKPYSDLGDVFPEVKYISLMREPIARYISHYQYWIQKLEKKITFEEFMSLKTMQNFQTVKIAGKADVELAKKIINERLFLIGVVEEFDDFLKILKAKLGAPDFDCRYVRKNVAKNNVVTAQIQVNMAKYLEMIEQNNALDIELYQYVTKEVFKRQKEMFYQRFQELRDYRIERPKIQWKKEILGKVYRKFYYGPIIDIIRYRNGLEVGGSY